MVCLIHRCFVNKNVFPLLITVNTINSGEKYNNFILVTEWNEVIINQILYIVKASISLKLTNISVSQNKADYFPSRKSKHFLHL